MVAAIEPRFNLAPRHRWSGACHADPLGLGPCRFKPASHFIACAIKHEETVGGCVRVPASHLWKPRLARLDDFVQVLEETILDFNWLSFTPVNNPFNSKHLCLSSPHLASQARLRRLLLPVGPGGRRAAQSRRARLDVGRLPGSDGSEANFSKNSSTCLVTASSVSSVSRHVTFGTT